MTRMQADCLAEALAAGHEVLRRDGAALMAVESSIQLLEASGLFNAGRGANRQLDGVQRMDASIMDGADLRAGAVASVEGILHPIAAAKLVLEKTDHVLLVGPSAGRFARHFNVLRYRSSQKRVRMDYTALLNRRRTRSGHGTVGAVALDRSGTISAGASTGGIDTMLPGRVGDTPLIGCGVYADNRSAAVSMTGLGEGIIRLAIAKSVCDRLRMGTGPEKAAKALLHELVTRVGGRAGMLVVSPSGQFALVHVTPYMAAGWWNGTNRPTVKAVWP